MSDYLFNPRSTFLNSLFLPDGVGSGWISPELQQVIATQQTRDAVRRLGDVQLASLYGQQKSFELQRDANEQLSQIGTGIGELSRNISSGLADGFGHVAAQVGQLAEGIQEGFEQIGLGLQTGFRAVVTGLYHVDDRLGQRLMAGFSSLGHQLQRQHGQMIGTLIGGFDFLADAVDRAAGQTVEAIDRAAEAQISAARETADYIARAVVETGRLQAEAVVAMHRDLAQRLGEISHHLQHQDANRTIEHFAVGMNFMNHADFRRAREQFAKARAIYSGHFPALFADGFCCRVLGEFAAAEDGFQAALSQSDPDPARSQRQRSLAALYLGRLAFDRREYEQARRWYYQSYSQNRTLWVALVEGAACLLLDTTRAARRAADGVAVKNELNAVGCQSANLMWYWLALTLVGLDPELAIEAFRHGFHGHFPAIGNDRAGLVALLWRLNPRSAGTLLDVLQAEFPWLHRTDR